MPQLADIRKLSLNSKVKKFSYSFIGGKGYSLPLGGENSFLSTVCGIRILIKKRRIPRVSRMGCSIIQKIIIFEGAS